jgi:hypothetical protein
MQFNERKEEKEGTALFNTLIEERREGGWRQEVA